MEALVSGPLCGDNEHLVREFLNWMRHVKGRRGGSVYNYQGVLLKMLAFVGHSPLAGITTDDLQEFVRRPREGRGKGRVGAAATQARDAAILRSFFRYCVERGLLERNPAVLLGTPVVRNENPRPIPDADWHVIWTSALPPDERVAYGLGFYVGLRRREVCELRVRQIDLRNQRLVGFTRKGGGDDITPYGDVVAVLDARLPALGAGSFADSLERFASEQKRRGVEWLMPMGESRSGAMRARMKHEIPDGMTNPDLLNKRLGARCRRLGLPHYTPHQLRHSFVTNLLRAGVPLHLVQKLANHSDPAVTSRTSRLEGASFANGSTRRFSRTGSTEDDCHSHTHTPEAKVLLPT
jgi:integrase